MAEEEEEAGEEEEISEAPSGSWIKQFVILAGVVLILQIVLSYVLVTRQVQPKLEISASENGEPRVLSEAEIEVIPVDAPVIFPLVDMLLNPSDDQTIRYLNTKISLELDSQELMDRLKEDPVTVAQIEEFVRETLNKTYFSKMNEPDERIVARENLKNLLNESGLLGEGLVSSVYFERFIMQ